MLPAMYTVGDAALRFSVNSTILSQAVNSFPALYLCHCDLRGVSHWPVVLVANKVLLSRSFSFTLRFPQGAVIAWASAGALHYVLSRKCKFLLCPPVNRNN